MFWKRSEKEQKGAKLPGPRDLPEPVKKYLSSDQNMDAGIIPFLKAVTRGSEKGEKVVDIRIFDPSDAEARNVKVQNYDTLSQNPEMIISEGWFDEASKKVELTSKNPVPRVKLFTRDEILRQIEGLKDPGSSVFFYTAAGAGVGGPLGRGAAVIRLNAGTSEKKQKKYTAYGVSVINLQPVKTEMKIFDSDKAKEIADWVSEAHKPRFC